MDSHQGSDGKKGFFSGFWAWYERHYVLALCITAGLFALQLVHLFWLTADVVASRLVGQSYFPLTPFWQGIIILVDYTEIPGLISTSVLYVHEMRKKFSWKSVAFLIFLNTQWIHLFWITDEFVVDAFSGRETGTVLPVWAAWIAILIDYLELPVIADTMVKVKQALSSKDKIHALKEAFEED